MTLIESVRADLVALSRRLEDALDSGELNPQADERYSALMSDIDDALVEDTRLVRRQSGEEAPY